MAELNLEKKDTENIPERSQLKITEVLREARSNHNELVDALYSINAVLIEINTKLAENPALAESVEFNAESIKDVKDNLMPALKDQMDNNLKRVKNELLVDVKENGKQIVDLEGHSRRKNVLINGKEEKKGEKVEEVARKFMVDDLKMDPGEVANFLFRDCHRLPKPKPREDGTVFHKPIIVAFVLQKDRNSVMRKAYELKNTDFSMKSDLPKPLNELRGKMLKERRDLMRANPGVKFRVTERGYKPVLQKEDGLIPGTTFIKWSDIKFPV